MNTSKKVLIISYYFPPNVTMGSFRVSRFARYLPLWGWEPIILTTRPENFPINDFSLLDDFSADVKIFRTHFLKLSAYFRRFCKSDDGHIHSKRKFIKSFSFSQLDGGTLLSAIQHLFVIPDPEVVWLPSVISGSRRIMANNNIDVVYTSGRPFSTHLIGYLLKRQFKKPWVAEFRDPWVKNPLFIPPTVLHKWLFKAMESKVLSVADQVIVVSQQMRRDFLRSYPELSPGKIKIIPTGCDSAEYKKVKKRLFKKFTITYTGTFDKRRTPINFLIALKKALLQKPSIKKNIKVIFIGNFPSNYRVFINQLNLSQVVTVKNYLPHCEVVQYQMNSHVLLLISYGGRETDCIVTGKIFEYLQAAKPILALIPLGAAADLIETFKAGFIVSPDDINGICDLIISLYERHVQNKLSVNRNRAQLKKFAAESLAKELAQILEGTISDL